MAEASIHDILAGKIDAGSPITIQGWVRTRRDSKAGFSFIQVNDGSSIANLQVVADQALPGYHDTILHLTAGCSIRCHGTLVESKGRGQAFEVQAAEVEVLGWVENPDTYPVQPKRHSFEFLRTVAHLRPRTNTFGAITRIRHSAAKAIHDYFDRNGFYWVNTPIITSSDAEGAGELFRISTLDANNPPRTDQGLVDFSKDFFGKETYLTVSGQLNVEAFCLAMSKVYTFGPTFRAENSNTARHLAEFWMIEPEIAFADLEDLSELAEDFLKSIFSDVLERHPDDMAFFAERIEPSAITRLEKLIESPFVRMDYGEAIRVLQNSGRKFEFKPDWGLDLQTEHERYLTEQHCQAPVIVMNYPDEIKAFYMRLNDDEKTVAAMDVLAPGIGEIIGGSQREERLDVLTRRMRAHDVQQEDYDWFLDLRRYGTVPHAGFGLGFERLLNYITGMSNIRDVIPYPRTPGSAPF
ncbi:MAG: asparagine--tRNA ligase [Pseudomonadota bacterium]